MLTIRIFPDSEPNDLSHHDVDRAFTREEGNIDDNYIGWSDVETWWSGDYDEAPFIYWRARTRAGELWLMVNVPAGADIAVPASES